MKKRSILAILFMVLILLLVLQGCTPSGDTAQTAEEETAVTPTAVPADTATPETETNETTMTLEELSQYNGQNGNPAYIAVDGVIYDVTSVSPWSGGNHNGFAAGQDLTEEIKTVSPHGVSKLNGLPVIGTLAD